MVLNVRNLVAWCYGIYLLSSGKVRKLKEKSKNGDFILSAYFHNPSKKLFEHSVKWFLKNGFTFISVKDLISIKENKLAQLLLQFKAWLLSPKLFWWPIAFLNSFLLTLLLTFKIFKGISHIAQIIKCLSFLNLSRDLSSTRLSIHHLFILTSSKTSTFNSISHYISNILQT